VVWAQQRIAEFRRIFQDPILLIGLIVVVIFIALAIIAPIRSMVQESGPDGQNCSINT
jgi:type II secretory pathway component PulF